MKSPPNASDNNRRPPDELPVFQSFEADEPEPAPPPHAERQASGTEDFAQLQQSAAQERQKPRKVEDTSFQALSKELDNAPKRYKRRTFADFLVEFLTPSMILVMVVSVVAFLLDWRYIFTDVFHTNLKVTSFFFLLGIVALNRLVAREGSDESIMYIVVFTGVVAMYTYAMTTMYGVGSVARGFLNVPYLATLLNMSIVAFIWWFTNRLMHECCVDEHPESGEVGILTGTARKIRKAIVHKPPPAEEYLVAVDPSAWKPPEWKPRKPLENLPVERLPKRHPGMSVFYFSVPVMIVFALGLRWLQHGGDLMVLTGHFYVGCYTLAALTLLMLTSLRSIRAYFRRRRIDIPKALAPFWLGVGLFMIAVVMFGAVALPKPPMPEIAYVDEHEYDPWTRGNDFELASVAATPARKLRDSRIIDYIGYGVLVVLGLFLLYALLRGIGAAAFSIARDRHRYPQWVVRLFNRLDRLIERLARLPRLPARERPVRVQRDIARCARFSNPLASPDQVARLGEAGLIEHAYSALCALAADIGSPRRPDQTPYEFIEAFPKSLKSLKAEAKELTDLYVASAYANRQFGEPVHDRLRRFWMVYERARARHLK